MADTPSSPSRRQYTPRIRSVNNEPGSSRRVSLILLGVGIIATVLVASWLGFFHSASENKLEIKEVKITDDGEIALTGARYRGVTSSGQPFTITADQASESIDGSGRIDLERPRAIVTMKNGEVVELRSDTGIFDQPDDHVDLAGSVIIEQNAKQLTFKSQELFADLKLGEMRSLVPVIVTDKIRRIDAESMRVFDNGDRILFGGKARMIMRQNSQQMKVK